MGFPRNTHRYFIAHLTKTKHIKFGLLKRFVSFVENIANSAKTVLRNMLSVVKHDCRSTTGRNLRNIMILVGKSNVNNISKDDLRSQY